LNRPVPDILARPLQIHFSRYSSPLSGSSGEFIIRGVSRTGIPGLFPQRHFLSLSSLLPPPFYTPQRGSCRPGPDLSSRPLSAGFISLYPFLLSPFVGHELHPASSATADRLYFSGERIPGLCSFFFKVPLRAAGPYQMPFASFPPQYSCPKLRCWASTLRAPFPPFFSSPQCLPKSNIIDRVPPPQRMWLANYFVVLEFFSVRRYRTFLLAFSKGTSQEKSARILSSSQFLRERAVHFLSSRLLHAQSRRYPPPLDCLGQRTKSWCHSFFFSLRLSTGFPPSFFFVKVLSSSVNLWPEASVFSLSPFKSKRSFFCTC